MRIKYLGFVLMLALALHAGKINIEAKEIYDVTQMGAVPGDDVPDTQAINKCIEKAVEDNADVYIPSGEYIIDNTIKVSGDVRIEMDNDTVFNVTKNMKYVIKAEYSEGKHDFELIGGMIDAMNYSSGLTALYVKNTDKCTIDGTSFNVKNGRGILIKESDNATIKNVDIIEGYENSINIQKSKALVKDITIKNISHKSTSGNGMYIRECDKVVVDNADITNVAYNGILCNTARQLVIKNSKIKRSNNCGFTIVNTDNILIQNNIIDDHSSDGIWIENKKNTVCTIKNNKVYNSMSGLELSSGIVVFYGKKVDIIENIVENVFNNAIYIKESDDINVSKNEVGICAQTGIVMLNVKGSISSNKVLGVNKAAISIHGMQGMVNKNSIKQSKSMGINIHECVDVFVEENDINKCGYAGIKVIKSENIGIYNNYINNMSNMAVYATESEEVDIRNNDIWDTKEIPIYETKCTKGAILDNIVKLSEADYYVWHDKVKCGKNLFFYDTYEDFMIKRVIRRAKYSRVVWNPIPDVDGYKIYRTPYGKNQWRCIGEVCGELEDTYDDYSVGKGKKYQYRIRGYIDGNLKTLYTRYTNIK